MKKKTQKYTMGKIIYEKKGIIWCNQTSFDDCPASCSKIRSLDNNIN